jgi:hypothetical protein
METEITPEIKASIESWIGDDSAIENCLFWNCLSENPLDAPAPLDEKSKALKEKAVLHYNNLKKAAVAQQRECDRTLHSIFRDKLLYTDVTVGENARGIAFRLIGSIDNYSNYVTLIPADDSGIEVCFAVEVKSDDSHSALQLAQLATRDMKKLELSATVLNDKNEPVTLDPKLMRKAVSSGENLGLGNILQFEVIKNVPSVETALSLSDKLTAAYLERFGLEAEYFNMGRKFPNVHILREENFNSLFSANKPLIIITSTLVCRRCRREIPEVYTLAGRYPQVNFALAQLTSPIQSFKKRAFADDIGKGSMQGFKENARGITPYTIAYKPDNTGHLLFIDYLSSKAHEAIPTLEETEVFIKRAFEF